MIKIISGCPPVTFYWLTDLKSTQIVVVTVCERLTLGFLLFFVALCFLVVFSCWNSCTKVSKASLYFCLLSLLPVYFRTCLYHYVFFIYFLHLSFFSPGHSELGSSPWGSASWQAGRRTPGVPCLQVPPVPARKLSAWPRTSSSLWWLICYAAL